MMPDDVFTPEEAAVVQRLRNAPQPQIRPQAFQVIQQRLLQELDAPSEPIPNSQPRSMPITPILLGIGVVVVLLIVVSLALTLQRNPTPTLPATDSLVLTATTTVTSTALPTTQATLAPRTQPIAQTESPVAPTGSALSSTIVAGTAVTPAISTMEPQAILVLEGPVQQINLDGIIVFDMQIRLDPDDPILKLVQVGKSVHVEGYLEIRNDVTVSVVVNIEIQKDNPALSTGLPSGCKVSKNGKIKCSKKKR
jgi:hypothetical protein